MKCYLLYTPGGDIVSWGRHDDPSSQAKPGRMVLEITAEQHAGINPMLQRVTDGNLVSREVADRDTAPAWAQVRARRNAMLSASDYVRLRAIDQGESIPNEWLVYRQALRDVTEQSDPFAIIWPTQPASG